MTDPTKQPLPDTSPLAAALDAPLGGPAQATPPLRFCKCELRNRRWNLSTKRCEACGGSCAYVSPSEFTQPPPLVSIQENQSADGKASRTVLLSRELIAAGQRASSGSQPPPPATATPARTPKWPDDFDAETVAMSGGTGIPAMEWAARQPAPVAADGAGHTPGPWDQEQDGNYRIIYGDRFTDKNGSCATRIACVEGNTTSQIVTQANADLIVSAPTLAARLAAAEAARAAAEDALKWYADAGNYTDGTGKEYGDQSILLDEGTRARAALVAPAGGAAGRDGKA